MDNSKTIKKSTMILRGISFGLILCVMIVGMFCLSATGACKKFFADMTGSSEFLYYGYYTILPTIEKVQEQNDYTKLIVGDSVCNNLFNDLQDINETYCMAGTNRGIGMPGQYLLIQEFLKNHKDATDVYLMVRPLSLDAQYDTQTGYMYAVAPFVGKGLIDGLDAQTLDEIASTYGTWAVRPEAVKLFVNSPMAAKIYLNDLNKNHFVDTYATERVSDVSYHYLEKMVALCEEAGVNFHFIAMPMADLGPNQDQVDEIDNYLNSSALAEKYGSFCDTVVYYDPAVFSDGQHLDSDLIDYSSVIRDIQKQTGELEDLVLPEE